MPRYQITGPDGRIVVVEGDSAPAEADAAEIFAGLSAPTSTPPATPSAPVDTAPVSPALDNPSSEPPVPSGAAPSPVGLINPDPARLQTTRSTVTGMTAPEAQVRGERGAAGLGQAAAGVVNPDVVVPTALRIVPPVLVGAGTLPANIVPGVGTAANLGATALAAGAGESLAQAYENVRGLRQGYSPGQTAASMVAGGLPIATVAAPVRGALPVATRVAGTGALLAGGGVAAETTRTLIDEGRMPTTREGVTAAAVPLAFGAGVAGVGIAAERATALAQRLQGRAALFAEAGVTPTPGMLNPEEGSFFPSLARGEAERAARIDPAGREVAAQVENAYAGLGSSINALSPNAPEGAALMREIRPLTSGLRESERAIQRLSREAQAAEARVAKAARDLDAARSSGATDALEASRQEYAAAADASFQAKFEDILGNARRLATAEIAPAGAASVDPATARTLFVEDVAKPLFQTFDDQSRALYGLVDNKLPAFQVAPVLAGIDRIAEEVTGGAPSRVAAAIKTIREGLMDPNATDETGKLIERPLQNVSLDQLRNLRAEITRRVNYDRAALNSNEERLLKGVAAEITQQITAQADTALGAQGGAALRQANAFYASTRPLFDAPGVEVLLKGDPSDSYVRQVLEGMRTSGKNSDEYRNVMRAADAIGAFAPEVATAARNHARSVLRQSVLFEAGALDSASGEIRVDPDKLASQLSKFSKVAGTLEELGLGTPRAVAQLQVLSKRYPDAGRLSAQEWQELFSAPAFAQLANDGRLATAIEPYLAQRSIESRLLVAANLEKAGKTAAAQSKLRQAEASAAAARQTVAAVRQRYEQMKADPAFVAFGNPALNTDNFNSFANVLFKAQANRVTNDDVRQIVTALDTSKDPANRALLGRLRERYIADMIASWGSAPAQGTAASRINVGRIREIFNPPNATDARNELTRAEAILSRAQMDRLRKLAKAAEELSRYEGAAGVRQGSTVMRTPRGTIQMGSEAVAGPVTGRAPAQTLSRGIYDSVVSMISRRKYAVAANMLANPEFMGASAGRLDTLSGLVNTVGAQRAMLLLAQNPALRREVEDDSATAKFADRTDGVVKYIANLLAPAPTS